jgi:CTP synthase (UTP-ammonia lyase)
MHTDIAVGIIGDFDPSLETHGATNTALQHAADFLAMPVKVTWVATPELEHAPADAALRGFQALWCAPSSPYRSMRGALAGIRFARESGWPFFGT